MSLDSYNDGSRSWRDNFRIICRYRRFHYANDHPRLIGVLAEVRDFSKESLVGGLSVFEGGEVLSVFEVDRIIGTGGGLVTVFEDKRVFRGLFGFVSEQQDRRPG
jgi:hypothetical protein